MALTLGQPMNFVVSTPLMEANKTAITECALATVVRREIAIAF